MIETPKIDAILETLQNRYAKNRYAKVDRFAHFKTIIAEGVQNKHIWNTDYEEAKSYVSSVWEAVDEAAYAPLREFYYRGDNRYSRSWSDTDPRHNLSRTQLLNTPGFQTRMLKVKDAPELAPYLEILAEMVPLALQIKAVKTFIEKGRKPNPNAVPADLTGTGHCAICGKLFKLDNNTNMVHHGFQISSGYGHYFGFRSGSCFGVSYKPYELSTEALDAYLLILERGLLGASISLEAFKETFPDRYTRTVGSTTKEFLKGTPAYDRYRELEISKQEFNIARLERSIEYTKNQISAWTLKALPHGDKVS